MTTEISYTWRDLRAEMTRFDVTTQQVADQLGITYAKLSYLLNAEVESVPHPEYVPVVLEAIKAAAGK